MDEAELIKSEQHPESQDDSEKIRQFIVKCELQNSVLKSLLGKTNKNKTGPDFFDAPEDIVDDFDECSDESK